MGLNPRQRAFVDEYVVDHNAAQAAVRAGYSVGRARQTGHDLLGKVEVTQAIGKLDDAQRDRSGVDRDWVVEKLVETFEKAFVGVQQTDREGNPIWSPAAANKALELLAKHLGMNVERHEVAMMGQVVYTLTLDRDLEQLEE